VTEFTESQLALMRGKNFAAIATIGEDGTPQTSIVWVDTDGEHLVFNTMNERAKGRNLRRDPRIGVSVFDAESPYRYFEVEGTAELDTTGADEHIEQLSQKYGGVGYGKGDRVIVRVKPKRIFSYQV